MQGDREVIRHLNQILKNELTSISRDFLHARMFKNWGYDRLKIGENVEECLKADLGFETKSREDLRAAIVHSESVRDFVTRELFEDILEDEEDHIDWLETQIGLIGEVGLQNYLQSQMGEEKKGD